MTLNKTVKELNENIYAAIIYLITLLGFEGRNHIHFFYFIEQTALQPLLSCLLLQIVFYFIKLQGRMFRVILGVKLDAMVVLENDAQHFDLRR
jgi:hypothetical protein